MIGTAMPMHPFERALKESRPAAEARAKAARCRHPRWKAVHYDRLGPGAECVECGLRVTEAALRTQRLFS